MTDTPDITTDSLKHCVEVLRRVVNEPDDSLAADYLFTETRNTLLRWKLDEAIREAFGPSRTDAAS